MPGLATDLWEYRPTAGSANAGGGFDSASGGTDYSNFDAAELQLTDLATSGIGVVTLTSVTGGFTALMIGNYIQIRSGTNVVAGFYRVVGHTDTNTVTLDRAPDDGVGGVSGGSGDLGGALDILIDNFFDAANAVIVPGSTIYVKDDGAMTLTAGIATLLSGTNLLPISILGYNTTRGDKPTLGDRPLVAAGANSFDLDNFWHVEHLEFTTTAALGISGDTGTRFLNCKSTNSGAANRPAFQVLTNGQLIKCEGISTDGEAFEVASSTLLKNCNAHDSNVGVSWGGSDNVVVEDCAIDTCGTGILATTNSQSNKISGSVFYTCTKGIETTGTGNHSWMLTNNVFDSYTIAVDVFEADRTWFLDHNCWDGSGTDVVNVSKGPNAVNADPLLNAPGSSDFTLQAGSPAIGTGMSLSGNVGVVGDYEQNIGVDQDDNAGAGAASILGGGQLTGGFS